MLLLSISFLIFAVRFKEHLIAFLHFSTLSCSNDKIVLSPEEIYEKEFKVDARGYRPQEVDNFLDLIIKDYSEFIKMTRSYEKEITVLNEENAKLKATIRKLEAELEAREGAGNSSQVNNVDLLRRISQLEKIVYSKMSNN